MAELLCEAWRASAAGWDVFLEVVEQQGVAVLQGAVSYAFFKLIVENLDGLPGSVFADAKPSERA